MTLSMITEPLPLELNTDGVVRVGRTRVTLDTVVAAFNQGSTAEEIVLQYPSLQLADVYAVISYYLRHQQEVETYLQQRQQRANEIRQLNEAQFDPQGVRDRLLSRRPKQS
ncbi:MULTISPECIES: DUF433 domain-containing protein [Nostocales]|uniref:DUF433 domain-containing protein n=3 Tax=Nostocales TaxID=1161 RepID=A0A0C1QXT4_9CYAN|nr:DUF433 domain-containing protein [Tolypothrix bouteillei]KAF3886320.1 DUF433 domain-containing protein [Tolypothrix bouteillei VB521301]